MNGKNMIRVFSQSRFKLGVSGLLNYLLVLIIERTTFVYQSGSNSMVVYTSSGSLR